ncbi:HNH endonuclease [Vibrio parahaemolyticus]|uniref:HNH endonuclease n=1 Tax=Vibrio harveyi group TaxID=717610 RepID=UPI000695B03D|nr:MULTISPECIES: HNH endonuclease signature motif containing protein [Vibrio harveyi group]EGQ7649814.1 HNH endonuclease [Vibrio alginolyticus]EGQ9245391.1 HNH endonuclease [Vibrio parahaemolyticus]EGR1899370.1 HNH endonuclease [Vibrio parahaemolyticus]EGR1922930.1 HNH endonuclease [Vibrio parahaemolyticus]ELB2751647.1 HNH endonuclease [Vibrio alginolyticus]
MSNFKDFAFKWTYGYADSVRELIMQGSNGLIDPDEFFELEGKDFLNKALKPNKETLLHDFVKESTHQEVSYFLSKAFDETVPEVYDVLNKYKAIYKPFNQYRGDDYTHYLVKKLEKYVFDKLADEVFTILYQDREFLRAFNQRAASYVSTLKWDDRKHRKYLQKDGVFIRCNRWPKWVRDGVFFRDKGRCAICHRDLTGLYGTGKKLAIDHIVPLANGGINDPTNLQILCQICNSKKGARSSDTGFKVATYWQ